jgi:parallel beta helix pectate lyase-like protein
MTSTPVTIAKQGPLHASIGGLIATIALLAPVVVWADAPKTYEVGDNQLYRELRDVPLDKLNPGDEVRVHGRAAPYKLGAKFTINRSGTAAAPIKIRGVVENNYMPNLDGNGATEHPTSACYFTSDVRSSALIGIMECPVSQGGDGKPPKYIEITGLELTNAQDAYQFQWNTNGSWHPYFASAAVGIYHASYVTIKGNNIHRNMNGTFTKDGYLTGQEVKGVLIEGNHFHDNGEPGSMHYHNAHYGEDHGTVIQFNRISRNLGSGAQIKTRGAGTIIRYNWIGSDEAGGGGVLPVDVVDAEMDSVLNDPNYGNVYAFGNVIFSYYDPAAKFIHMGFDGDPPNTQKNLYLFRNTFVSFNVQPGQGSGCNPPSVGSTLFFGVH